MSEKTEAVRMQGVILLESGGAIHAGFSFVTKPVLFTTTPTVVGGVKQESEPVLDGAVSGSRPFYRMLVTFPRDDNFITA